MASNHQQQASSPQRTGGMGSNRGRIIICIVIFSALIFMAAKGVSSPILPVLQGAAAWGDPIPGNGQVIGVSDSGTTRAISGDSSGHVNVNVTGTPSITGTVAVSNFPGSTINNPCFDPGTTQNSVIFNLATAATTQLIAPSGSTVIYVCGFSSTMVGTLAADTLLLETGTGATCGTGTSVKTGTYNSGILTAGAVSIAQNVPLKPSAAGDGLCIITTVGTGPAINGTVSYVQK